jgi:hypothetical protein
LKMSQKRTMESMALFYLVTIPIAAELITSFD